MFIIFFTCRRIEYRKPNLNLTSIFEFNYLQKFHFLFSLYRSFYRRTDFTSKGELILKTKDARGTVHEWISRSNELLYNFQLEKNLFTPLKNNPNVERYRKIILPWYNKFSIYRSMLWRSVKVIAKRYAASPLNTANEIMDKVLQSIEFRNNIAFRKQYFNGS